MRGKIKSCDTCRNKKVKCEGTKPCKYCLSHSIECTYHHVPKKIARYAKKNTDAVVNKKVTDSRNGKLDLESRLTKIESLLEVFLKKMHNQDKDDTSDPGTTTSTASTVSDSSDQSTEFVTEMIACSGNENNAKAKDRLSQDSLVVRPDFNNSTFEIYDKIVSGDYFSISSFSRNGLDWAADCIQDPFVVFPLKNLIPNFITMERSLLSVWTDPVDSSRLVILPPRKVIYTVISSFSKICFFDLPYVQEVEEIIERYCDSRDGLIPKQNFSYGELLFLNACVLMGCNIYCEKLKVGMLPGVTLSYERIKVYERLLLDNTLYYFHRVSIMDEGLDSMKGLTILCFYTDIYAFSQSTHSITAYIIRRAVDLGLHRAEYYNRLSETEKYNTLCLWWVCYYFDKFTALKTGKAPMMNDETITAPPLPHLQEFCDDFGEYGPRSGLRRDELHSEIAEKTSHLLQREKGIQQFYYIFQVDFATIISKLHVNVLYCNSSNSSRSLDNIHSILRDLENWKLCFPESIRPGGPISRYNNPPNLTDEDVSKYFVVSDLNMNYYYFKMMLQMLAVKNSTGFERSVFARQGLDTAKSLLNAAIGIGRTVTQACSLSLFYTFGAYLTLSTFCLQDPSRDGVSRDVSFLKVCCKELFSSFTQANHSPEKWILINAVSKCMLYIVAHVVMEASGNLQLNLSGLLNEVSEIQQASNFKHLCSFLNDRIENKTDSTTNVSEIPVSSSTDSNFLFDIPDICREEDQSSRTTTNDHPTNSSSSSRLGLDDFSELLKEGMPVESDFLSNIVLPASTVLGDIGHGNSATLGSTNFSVPGNSINIDDFLDSHDLF